MAAAAKEAARERQARLIGQVCHMERYNGMVLRLRGAGAEGGRPSKHRPHCFSDRLSTYQHQEEQQLLKHTLPSPSPPSTHTQVAAQHQEEQHALEERIEERLKEAAWRR